MKPVAFDYVRAESVEQALDLLAEAGDDAALLAGGMSLGPMLNLRVAAPALVIDLNRTSGLDEVAVNGEASTGAMLRQAAALSNRALMDADVARGAYNVASGRGVAIRTVLDTMIGLSPVTHDVLVDPERFRPNDVPRFVGSPDRLVATTCSAKAAVTKRTMPTPFIIRSGSSR